jgi:hypothetical protein
MPIVKPPLIAQLPVAPYVGDPDFDAHADALLGQLESHRQQINATNDATYTNALHVEERAGSAEGAARGASQSEAAAAQSAIAAAAAAGAVKWTAGTAYAEGAVVWSPANGLNYRRKLAGSGGNDPSSDIVNWWVMGAPMSAPIQRISSDTLAQTRMHYVIEAALTLTLPAAPALSDVVQITDLSDSMAVAIHPNGALIRGASGVMTLDVLRAAGSLVYSGSAKGWV